MSRGIDIIQSYITWNLSCLIVDYNYNEPHNSREGSLCAQNVYSNEKYWILYRICHPIDISTLSIAQLVKRVNGFEIYKKWAKLDPCFSFDKPAKKEILHFLGWSWPKICTKIFSPHCWKYNFVKIRVNVQKRLKGASAEADFWHGENMEHVKKKSSKERLPLRPPSWWNWTSKIKKMGILAIFPNFY